MRKGHQYHHTVASLSTLRLLHTFRASRLADARGLALMLGSMTRRIIRISIALVATACLAVAVLVSIGYGYLPLPSNRHMSNVAGFETGNLVLGSTTGFTDYNAYYRFNETESWAKTSAVRSKLTGVGQMRQDLCLEISLETAPWWYTIKGNPVGQCWKHEQSGYRHILFFEPSKQVVLVHSFSW